MKNRHLLHLLHAVLITLSSNLSASPRGGDVDLSFDPGSTVNGDIRAVAVQSDGKVIIAGTFTQVHGMPRTNVARLNPDGSTDGTFTPITLDSQGEISQVLSQTNGKLVIGGEFGSVNGVPRRSIARLNSDGTLDPSFQNGMAGLEMSFQPQGQVYYLVAQSGGKFLVSGMFDRVNGSLQYRIVRLNSDGSLDTTFNNGSGNPATAIAVQPDGKLLVAANTLNRLTANGTLDNTFQTSYFDNGANDGTVNAIAVQADGKVLVGGYFDQANGILHNGIARLNSNGTLDTNFQAGVTLTNFYTGTIERGVVQALALQADGKIVVGGGFTLINATDRAFVGRLNPEGSLDPSFSPNVGGVGYPYAVDLINALPDGKLLIAGRFTSVNGAVHSRIARLTADGGLESGFQNGPPGLLGKVISIVRQTDGKLLLGGYFAANQFVQRLNPGGSMDTNFQTSFEGTEVRSVALQSDGKIVVAGDFGSVEGAPRHGIARLNMNGTVDTGFQNGMSGVTIADTVYGDAKALAIQPDGKILVVGNFNTVNGVPRNAIARLNPDGSLDSDFLDGMSGPDGPPLALALQLDGRILVGGDFQSFNGISRPSLVRLNSNGSVDSEFLNEYPNYSPRPIHAIAFQSDGKILVAGASPGYNVARFYPDGTVDNGFLNEVDGYLPLIECMTVQADDKILIGGQINMVDGAFRHGLARLNSNGTLDRNFLEGMGGIVSDYSEDCLTIFVQPDGKVIVGGNFPTANGVVSPNIARLYGTIPNLEAAGFNTGQFQFNLSGYPGQVAVVEASTNLAIWEAVHTNTLGTNTLSFSDPDSAAFSCRFYRARLQ